MPSRDMLVRRSAPPGTEGRVFGIVSTGFNIGGAVGPVLYGWLLDHGQPRGLFIASAGAFDNLSGSYQHTYDRLHFADLFSTGGDPAEYCRLRMRRRRASW